MGSPDLRRRFNVGLAVWVVVLGALGLFLAAPLENSNLHPGLIDLQQQAKAALVLLAPYGIVGVLGAGVGLAELTSTFGDYPREAIATRWGQYLVWLNALAAVGAFFIARAYAPPDTNTVILILTVGVGFQTLVRTKFTLAKQFGGEGGGDLSVNIGWLYEQFQNLCKKQIDLELMTYRRTQVDRLLTHYPTVKELYQTALYTLKARATLTPEEETAKLEELQQIIDPKVPPEVARMNLGLLILELGGVAYVDLLVRAREMAPAAAAGGAEPSTASLVKRLTELPLDDLVALALEVLKSPEDEAWIKRAAAPAPGITPVRQKAPIAYYLVENAGVEAVSEALAKRGSR
jgi:hypothetical protein